MLDPSVASGCKKNLATALGNSVNWAAMYLSFAIGTWYGAKLIISPFDEYTIGQVVIVFWGITGCGYNIGYAAPYLETFQTGRSAAKSVLDVVERESQIDSFSEKGKKLNQNFTTDIEFNGIFFSYPTRPEVSIINGLNLKIKSGEIVALVGSSGCGKSTIMQLLQRFYDPDKGEILLDGVNLKDLNIGWLRQQLGVVGQEPVLFDASIRENILLGLSKDLMGKVSDADIEKAAEEANALEFIKKLPEGFNSYVGDRGTQLSGGQKQRIAIARALISKPKILLLDEATSALDLQSEQVVQTALDRASQGRTTIIIAHRLSTIINADRIIFLDKGKVAEVGTHSELMKLKKNYFSLVMAQQVAIGETSQNHAGYDFGPNRRCASTIRSEESAMSWMNSKKYDVIDEEDLKSLKETKFPHLRLFKLIWLDKYYFGIAFISALIYGLSTPAYAVIFGEWVNVFAISTEPDFLMEESIKYAIYFVLLCIGIIIFMTLQVIQNRKLF